MTETIITADRESKTCAPAIYTGARLRRLRGNAVERALVRETQLQIGKLIYPLFIVEGKKIKKPVASMPGIFQQSIDQALIEIETLVESGISAVILFGIPNSKDSQASSAWAKSGVVQTAIREIKDHFPNLCIIADTCLCEYMDHGHCGIVADGRILNDPTLEILARAAVSQAEAGADMIAPSDMMDGNVAAIRVALDAAGFASIPIMAYSAKFASALYSPFRDAAGSQPLFGDRRTYQMDPANSREALREIELDIAAGADIIMVKPAIAYLDIVAKARVLTKLPIAAYNVSGEYAMVKAAALQGWVDEKKVVLEMLTGIVRAGADLIITYHAKDTALWLKHQH